VLTFENFWQAARTLVMPAPMPTRMLLMVRLPT
jgi:hypothetical protein